MLRHVYIKCNNMGMTSGFQHLIDNGISIKVIIGLEIFEGLII